jgi:hypothetical protein
VNRVSGGYQVTIQDHASCQQATAESNTLDECWRELERTIAAGGEVFRNYKSYRVRDPLKRKKRQGT